MIDVDDIPLKDLLINKKKVVVSKKSIEAKGKGPMQMRWSKKQVLEKVDVLLREASTLS